MNVTLTWLSTNIRFAPIGQNIDSLNVSGIQRFNRYYICDRLNDLINGTRNLWNLWNVWNYGCSNLDHILNPGCRQLVLTFICWFPKVSKSSAKL